MKKELMIKKIEDITGFKLNKMIERGYIFKCVDYLNPTQYKIRKDIYKNKRKLRKIFEDLKFKGFIYVPF